MPSFPDSIFLFVLALLLFGPKRLPVLAREVGKWVGEFRRASNEFKMQMEDELRLSEQTEKNKQIAAMEAAAPVAAPIMAELEAKALAAESAEETVAVEGAAEPVAETVETKVSEAEPGAPAEHAEVAKTKYEVVDGVRTPLPIAVSGDLKIMPPATGLPAARSAVAQVSEARSSEAQDGALSGLLDAIPAASPAASPAVVEAEAAETTANGN
ncbi:MAG: twin-arginine translocase TatA/TatE family subunit [Acidobacteriaceae bacterium]